MKTLITLLLCSLSIYAAQPPLGGRRVVLELDGSATNLSLITPSIGGTAFDPNDKLDVGSTFSASTIVSGAFDEARIGVGAPSTGWILGFDQAGYPIWTNRADGLILGGTANVLGQVKSTSPATHTGTNWIVDLQAGKFQRGTLSAATTWITFTNMPSATDEDWSMYLKVEGADGSRDVVLLNEDTFTWTTLKATNNLAAGLNGFVVGWESDTRTIAQFPDPWFTIADPDGDGKPSVLDMGAGLVKTDASGNVSAASAGTDYLNLTTLTNSITFALSDMTTALTTGTNKNYWYAPAAGLTIKGVRATLATASSSGTPTVDINEAGTTILSTKITIDANEWDSATAATAPVISDSAIAGNAKVDFDIDVAGTGAAGLQVQILYTVP